MWNRKVPPAPTKTLSCEVRNNNGHFSSSSSDDDGGGGRRRRGGGGQKENSSSRGSIEIESSLESSRSAATACTSSSSTSETEKSFLRTIIPISSPSASSASASGAATTTTNGNNGGKGSSPSSDGGAISSAFLGVGMMLPSTSRMMSLLRFTCAWLVAFVIVNTGAYLVATPAHIRTIHKKAMEDQLAIFAKSISDRKQSLQTQVDDVTKEITWEKSNLTLLQNAADKILGQITFVSRSHHDEEIGKLRMESNTKQEEINKLSIHKDKLNLEMNEKHVQIQKMQDEIEKSEVELQKLRDAMDILKMDLTKFCSECEFNYQGLRTSCGARKEYLISHHGTPVDDATEAVMKWDTNCVKKSNRS